MSSQPDVVLRTRGARDTIEIPRREIRTAWEGLGRPTGEDRLRPIARVFSIPEICLHGKVKAWLESALDGAS